MDSFITWVQATRLSQAIVFSTWIWPLCEIIHFVGLALVIGIAGFFDVRLMGGFKRVPVLEARSLMPFAIFGFALNLTTGLVFLIGHPEQYAHNPSWWWKMTFLCVAALNAFAFEKVVAPRLAGLGEGAPMPLGAKLAGGVSLVAWFAVLYFGRMLPFLGNAY
jgi:hypothetical protein